MMLSPSQARILAWFVAYPGLKLHYEPGEWCTWTAAWANEQARRNMLSTIVNNEALFGEVNPEFARISSLAFTDWATPRCSTTTFEALRRHGLVRQVARSRHTLGGYYVISAVGQAAIAAHDAPVQPVAARPEQHCACGWRGHSMGGHALSKRHRLWLYVQRYSQRVRTENAAVHSR